MKKFVIVALLLSAGCKSEVEPRQPKAEVETRRREKVFENVRVPKAEPRPHVVITVAGKQIDLDSLDGDQVHDLPHKYPIEQWEPGEWKRYIEYCDKNYRYWGL